jgi:lactoylglutathione lyase
MITAIGHAAFNVSNLDQSLDFYTRQLGFSEMFRLYNDEGVLWIIYLRVSDTVYLELFPSESVEPNKGSYSHLCLEVDDMQATVEELKSRGVSFDSENTQGKDSNRQSWIRDPDDNRIELMEMSPTSMQRQAIERLRAEKAAG